MVPGRLVARAGLGDTLGGTGAGSQNDDMEKAEEEPPASSKACLRRP